MKHCDSVTEVGRNSQRGHPVISHPLPVAQRSVGPLGINLPGRSGPQSNDALMLSTSTKPIWEPREPASCYSGHVVTDRKLAIKIPR
jgi:hypothetical protein